MSAVSLELSSDRELVKESIARALALAEALDQPNSLARALYESAMCYQLATDREATFAAAQRVGGWQKIWAVAISRSWPAFDGLGNRGWV